ncbi:MAG TPA: zinc ribbon domain-containing protein [Candidatus Dormibacteraeota bacterium]
MPIYEYRCEACSGQFEVLTSYAGREKAQVCPQCESTRTRVLVSSFASFGEEGGLDFTPSAGGGGCACGGACSCGGPN